MEISWSRRRLLTSILNTSKYCWGHSQKLFVYWCFILNCKKRREGGYSLCSIMGDWINECIALYVHCKSCCHIWDNLKLREPRVNSKPNINIYHDRRLLIMYHIYVYTYIEKKTRRKKTYQYFGSRLLNIRISGVIFLVVLLLFSKLFMGMYITLIIRKNKHKEKRLFSLRS